MQNWMQLTREGADRGDFAGVVGGEDVSLFDASASSGYTLQGRLTLLLISLILTQRINLFALSLTILSISWSLRIIFYLNLA